MLNMGFMPEKTGFVFLKVQNRGKNPIFVPENLSIYILDTVPKRSNRPKKTIGVPTLLFRSTLDLVCYGILQSDVFSDCQAQTHRSQVL